MATTGVDTVTRDVDTATRDVDMAPTGVNMATTGVDIVTQDEPQDSFDNICAAALLNGDSATASGKRFPNDFQQVRTRLQQVQQRLDTARFLVAATQTNRKREAGVYSRDEPIGSGKRGYILVQPNRKWEAGHGVHALLDAVSHPVVAVAHLQQEREGGGRLALQNRLAGAAEPGLVVAEGDGVHPPDQVGEGRVLDEVLENLPVRGADELRRPSIGSANQSDAGSEGIFAR
eukprot:295383-Prorocentrum_minimum.AAC.2